MHFTAIVTLAVATVAAAASGFERRQQGAPAAPLVSLFRETDFGGQQQQFPANGACVTSSFDGFQSVRIPVLNSNVETVWCDIYNDEACDSMYASIRASVADIAFYGPTRIPKGVVCEVRPQ